MQGQYGPWGRQMQSKDREVTDGSTRGKPDGGEDARPTPVRVENRDLGLDQVFEVLKNQRRRYVLQYLRDQSGPVSLSELSEQVAAWENGKKVRSITSSERKRVYVGLYQCHLPKMDGMDIIEFNKPQAIIEPGENVVLLYEYLDAPRENADGEFPKYYLGLSAAMFAGLVVAALIEAAVGFPAVGVTAGIAVLAFGATAMIHYSRANGSDRLTRSTTS